MFCDALEYRPHLEHLQVKPANLRFIALATDRPKLVLPTPGGPTKHKIDFYVGLSFLTARYP